jgi:hypothetical protein
VFVAVETLAAVECVDDEFAALRGALEQSLDDPRADAVRGDATSWRFAAKRRRVWGCGFQ